MRDTPGRQPARRGRLLAALVALTVAAGCAAPMPDSAPSPTARVPSGGILRIGIVDRPAGYSDPYPYDYHDPKWGATALMRCCLVRTLLAYNGTPAAQGGSVPRPDIATGAPEISSDGLTWTFHIKPGLKYAPPYGDRTIEAADFIRALERNIRWDDAADTGDLRAIEGVPAYLEGAADSISGVEAHDPLTLVFRLSRPAGGFAHAIASPAMAPIPAGAVIPPEEDYGPLLIASGPYMFEGAEGLPGRPVNEGLDAHTLTLIRSPSWDATTDGLRAANADRIEIRPAGPIDEALAKVESGELDFLDVSLTGEELARYRADPALRGRIHATTNESLYYIQMNLALPPFDDVHVRRAINFAVDKVAVMDAHTAWRSIEMEGRFLREIPVVAHHTFPDTHVRGLLFDYDPFPSADAQGDVSAARAEMAQSRYDTNRDGLCDAPACSEVSVSSFSPETAAVLVDALGSIGIAAHWRETSEDFGIERPQTMVPIQLNWSLWFSSMDGAGHAVLLAGGANAFADPAFTINGSLVGAPSQLLEDWGYPVTEVPSLDDKLQACDHSVSYLRFVCYAELDQLTSEQVVPWVPVYSHLRAWLVSGRVTAFSLDQSSGVAPAIDQISVTP